MIQLGERIDQHEQPWRDFRCFPTKDLTQPVADLVANRTAMDVVKHRPAALPLGKGPFIGSGLI